MPCHSSLPWGVTGLAGFIPSSLLDGAIAQGAIFGRESPPTEGR